MGAMHVGNSYTAPEQCLSSVCVQRKVESSVSRAARDFKSKAHKDVAKSLESLHSKVSVSKQSSIGFPSFTTSHESCKMSISIGTKSRRSE